MHAQCRNYCRRDTCSRLDCMQCSWCNATASQVATAVRGIKLNREVLGNCSGSDGSFSFAGLSTWPGPMNILDAGLAQIVLEIVGSRSLLDVGAGSGQYGAWFEAQRQRAASVPVPAWRGVDGGDSIEEYTRRYGPPGSLTRQVKLCDPALRLPPASWAMSIEVGEHLPEACLHSYVSLLSRSARTGLIVSWAHSGQSGYCARQPDCLAVHASYYVTYPLAHAKDDASVSCPCDRRPCEPTQHSLGAREL